MIKKYQKLQVIYLIDLLKFIGKLKLKIRYNIRNASNDNSFCVVRSYTLPQIQYL